jgi:hypothetical protein
MLLAFSGGFGAGAFLTYVLVVAPPFTRKQKIDAFVEGMILRCWQTVLSEQLTLAVVAVVFAVGAAGGALIATFVNLAVLAVVFLALGTARYLPANKWGAMYTRRRTLFEEAFPIHSPTKSVSRYRPRYHELQWGLLCALHATNNMLQQKRFTQKHFEQKAVDMHKYASTLGISVTTLNPHKSLFRLGNYDVNVLMAILKDQGFEASYLKGDTADIDLGACFGVICNKKSNALFGLTSLRHWYSLRAFSDHWYNLDSKFPAPQHFISAAAVHLHLRTLVKEGGTILLVSRIVPSCDTTAGGTSGGADNSSVLFSKQRKEGQGMSPDR